MPAITQAKRLERKQNVPDKDRTPDREAVADFIEAEILDEWPVTISEIAERTSELEQAPEGGYSRQHVSNTLNAMFDAVEENSQTKQNENEGDSSGVIEIPDGVDRDSYLRGYVDANIRNQD